MCVVLVRCVQCSGSVFLSTSTSTIPHTIAIFFFVFLSSDFAVRCSNIQQHTAIDCLVLMSRCTLCAYFSYFCFLIPIQRSKWCYTKENPHYSIETCLTYIRVCLSLNLKKIFFSFFFRFLFSLSFFVSFSLFLFQFWILPIIPILCSILN